TAQATYGWIAAQDRTLRLRLIWAAAVAGALFIPWLPVLWAQIGVASSLVFWAPPFSLASLGKTFEAFAGLYFNMAANHFYLPTVFGIYLVLGAALAIAFMRGLQEG